MPQLTVEELIELLNKQPHSAKVFIEGFQEDEEASNVTLTPDGAVLIGHDDPEGFSWTA